MKKEGSKELWRREKIVAYPCMPPLLESAYQLVNHSLTQAYLCIITSFANIWDYVVNEPAWRTDQRPQLETIPSWFCWNVLLNWRKVTSIWDHSFISTKELLWVEKSLQH